MSKVSSPSSSEREQTDESLRLERERADEALAEELAGIDEAADAVIGRARRRADEVLAAARERTDAPAAASAVGVPPSASLAKERKLEDRVLREERADADETLREERADHVALLRVERAETDRDLSSERARSDAALATRDEFLGIVSHDLRDLLNTIVLQATLIANAAADGRPGNARDQALRIQRAGGRMNRLIGDLLDVASIDAGALAVTLERCDPVEVVTEAASMFEAQASASGVTLTVEIASPLGKAALDPARILQVLGNLLGNALKFTPTAGAVVVRVERVGADIDFAVSDTGAGIPTDKLETVFERFVQASSHDRRGVGLGLYISKCIVQGHGGRIWAESTPGAGSTFCFTLPASVA
jgi:signal transduction histidine kinase